MNQLRLRFSNDDLKEKLEELAETAELSVNELAVKILSAQFSSHEKNSLQMLLDLHEFKTANRSGNDGLVM